MKSTIAVLGIAAALAAFAVNGVYAQFMSPPVIAGVSADAVDAKILAAVSTLQASIPQPADAVPPPDTLNGAVGSSMRYMRQDAPRPSISQRTTVLTDAAGNWSVSWARSFASATPAILAIPLNNGANPVTCNVIARNASSASGRCWQTAAQNVGLIALNISLSPTAAPTSTPVMLVGLEPSQ